MRTRYFACTDNAECELWAHKDQMIGKINIFRCVSSTIVRQKVCRNATEKFTEFAQVGISINSCSHKYETAKIKGESLVVSNMEFFVVAFCFWFHLKSKIRHCFRIKYKQHYNDKRKVPQKLSQSNLFSTLQAEYLKHCETKQTKQCISATFVFS